MSNQPYHAISQSAESDDSETELDPAVSNSNASSESLNATEEDNLSLSARISEIGENLNDTLTSLLPPSYEQAQECRVLEDENGEVPAGEPPSYEQTFDFVRDSFDVSTDQSISASTGIYLAFNLCLIVISVYFWNAECKPEDAKIFLRFLGMAGLLSQAMSFVYKRISDSPENSHGLQTLVRMIAALRLFLLIWFVMGCIWVYKAYDYSEPTCNKLIYNTAFWIVTVPLAIICMMIGYILFFCCARLFCCFESFRVQTPTTTTTASSSSIRNNNNDNNSDSTDSFDDSFDSDNDNPPMPQVVVE